MPNSNYGMLFEPPSGEIFVPPVGNVEHSQDSSTIENDRAISKSVAKRAVVEYRAALKRCADKGVRKTSTRDAASPDDVRASSHERQLKRHYLKEAFQAQGMSLAYCARKMGISVEEALRQMDPDYNLTLSQMFAWSEALDVPLPELLPFDSRTSDPIRNRGLLLRIVKTARTIQNLSHNTPVQYAAQTLVDQLIELIPEYASVEPWPTVGKSRAAKSEGVVSKPIDPGLSRLIEENS